MERRKGVFIVIILLSSFMLSSCATIGSDLDTWIGSSVDEYVSVNGPPRSTYKYQDGRTISTWDKGCVINLISDKRVILSWSLKGCLKIHPSVGQWKKPS